MRGTGADNPAGRIASGRNLSAEAERLENRASFILANGDIALSGRELSNQSWQTGTENEYLVYLSFMMSGLTGVGTAGKGYYANQLLGAGSAYMSSQIEGQDSTASVR